jgi:hypothetical protein
MKLFGWLVVAAIGLATTIWAYRSDRPAEGFTKISSGVIVAAKTVVQRIDGPMPFPSIKAGVKQLPTAGISAMLAASSGGSGDRGRSLRFQISEKLVQVSFAEAGLNESSLAWGKLPRVGANEALAGAEVARRERIQVGDASYIITGGIAGAAGLFARTYVLPADERAGEHDEAEAADFRAAVLIPLDIGQLSNRQVEKQLAERFPPKDYDRTVCFAVAGPRTFSLTLLGEGLFLLGGTGVFLSLYAALAGLPTGVLREPLAALSNHRRLSWSVHLIYFGLYLLVAALVYRAPDLRNAVQAIIHAGLNEGGGILHFAGTAYRSGSIARAALVTFAVNFFLGSVLFLTVPSCVLPGSGALLAAFRAVSWGLLLAPATLQQAAAMLPHTGTLLLEGEAYILATFFGLMIPLALFRRQAESDSTPKFGYGRAVLLNLKGSVLVAIVLAVSAIYEAAEVIHMLRSAGAV